MKINTLIIKNNSILSEGFLSLMQQDTVFQVTSMDLEIFLNSEKEALKSHAIILAALPLESKEYKNLLAHLKLLEMPAMMIMPISTINDFRQVVKYKVKGYISFACAYEAFAKI